MVRQHADVENQQQQQKDNESGEGEEFVKSLFEQITIGDEEEEEEGNIESQCEEVIEDSGGEMQFSSNIANVQKEKVI